MQSVTIDALIEMLKKDQAEVVRHNLLTPPGRDGYALGQLIGVYQTYERILNTISEMLEAEDNAERER